MRYTHASDLLPGAAHLCQQDHLPIPSTLPAADQNMVIWSLMEIVNAAGLAAQTFNPATPATYQVLLNAVNALIRRASPVGEVIQGYWTAAPAGTLILDGSVVSRTTYAALWAHAQAIGAVVTDAVWTGGSKGLFSSGDGATTFRLPDVRDEFLRAKSAARALGSLQAGAVQAHKHVGGLGTSDAGAAAFGATNGATHAGTTAFNTNNYLYHTNDGNNFNGNVNANGVIDTETRPRNVALLTAIYY